MEVDLNRFVVTRCESQYLSLEMTGKIVDSV